MVALATVASAMLGISFLAAGACAADPAGVAELHVILVEGGLEDAREASNTLRGLGLGTLLEVELLDTTERLELAGHLKAAEISLGDRARLRRMTSRRVYTGDNSAAIAYSNERDKTEGQHRQAQTENSHKESSTLSMDTAALVLTALFGCGGFIIQARVAKAADLNQMEIEQSQALHGPRPCTS
jgi:hypothetical protein